MSEQSARVRLTPEGKLAVCAPHAFSGREFVVPFSIEGLAVLHTVLKRAAEVGPDSDKGKIGYEANPTQALVDEWLRNNSPTTQATLAKARLMEEYGLSDDDLDDIVL